MPRPTPLPLPPDAVAFIEGGGRDLELSRLRLGATPAAGSVVPIETTRGDDLGLAVVDPDNDLLRVLATPADGFTEVGAALLGLRVERALALRRTFGLAVDGASYRLLHGAGDGLPGFACDVFGEVAVLWVYSPALLPLGRMLAEAIRGFTRLRGVQIKVRARGGAADVVQESLGEVAETVIAHELGVPFEIHPKGGLNAGLFTDMRDHRRGLSRFAAGRRVLNLFSYTGALSVACARAGAAAVTSVDTSDGVQAWAQVNFRLSGFDTGDRRWRFDVGDAVRYLARGARDKETWELVLIDPPTFSTARGKAWTLERDYPALIAAAANLLPSDGLLWLAANTHELGSLTRLAHKGFRQANRSAALLEQGSLPPDYPTVPAQPRDRYLQVCLFRVF